MGVPQSLRLLSLLVSATAVTAAIGATGSGAGGWHWPSIRLSSEYVIPAKALRCSISSSLLASEVATLGITPRPPGLPVAGSTSPWVVVTDNYRDVAALGMSLCTRGDRVGCSPLVESVFMDYVAQRVEGYSVTGLGTDVDMEIGLYPAASLACVLRVKQWMAESAGPATWSNGGIAGDGQRIPTPQATTATGKALAARYSFLYRELMIQGWISWLRGPRPVPRPYPFPKVTNFT
jgi:hypothetical protein